MNKSSFGASSVRSVFFAELGLAIVVIMVSFIWRLLRNTARNLGGENTPVSPITQDATVEASPIIEMSDTQITVIEDPLMNEAGQSVSDFLPAASNILGQEVIVKGRVDRKMGDWGVYLRNTGDKADEVVVITNARLGATTGLEVDTQSVVNKYVRVHGVAKLLSKKESEEEFGFEVDDLIGEAWEDQVVLVAQRIEVLSL